MQTLTNDVLRYFAPTLSAKAYYALSLSSRRLEQVYLADRIREGMLIQLSTSFSDRYDSFYLAPNMLRCKRCVVYREDGIPKRIGYCRNGFLRGPCYYFDEEGNQNGYRYYLDNQSTGISWDLSNESLEIYYYRGQECIINLRLRGNDLRSKLSSLIKSVEEMTNEL
jgi:hypothetical protein